VADWQALYIILYEKRLYDGWIEIARLHEFIRKGKKTKKER